MTAHRRKTCRVCATEKHIGEFYRHPNMADGYLNECKSCKRKYVNENRELKFEHYSAYDRARCMRPDRVAHRKAYFQTPQGKASIARANRAYRISRKAA